VFCCKSCLALPVLFPDVMCTKNLIDRMQSLNLHNTTCFFLVLLISVCEDSIADISLLIPLFKEKNASQKIEKN
jgi:hypothetical protein